MTSRIELQLAIVIKIFSYHSHLASYINWEMNNYLFKVLCSMQGSILKVAVICNLQLQHIYNNAFKYYFMHHNEILEEEVDISYFVK